MSLANIGKTISSLRQQKGVTQETLATAVGVSPQAVSKWENGGVPDTELLPLIADYFEVSLDSLFGRNVIEVKNIEGIVAEYIEKTPKDEQFDAMMGLIWQMEMALFPAGSDGTSLKEIRALAEEDVHDRAYSSMMRDDGFTRMGLSNKGSQYFLAVPNVENKEKAYFEGVDYPAFFKDFSDRDVFNACVFLHKRESGHSFTPKLFEKNLGLSPERAEKVMSVLTRYGLVHAARIEMDDEIITVYSAAPTPSFVALLIFAREIIYPPKIFYYQASGRLKPYLK